LRLQHRLFSGVHRRLCRNDCSSVCGCRGHHLIVLLAGDIFLCHQLGGAFEESASLFAALA
jgi:hypothetical protein